MQIFMILLLSSCFLVAQDAAAKQEPLQMDHSIDEPVFIEVSNNQEGSERPRGPFGGGLVAKEIDSPRVKLPTSVRTLFRQVAEWQRKINRYLATQLRITSQNGGFAAMFTVILASFIYGVLHAAGPGHGKLVVGSYFTAREAPLRTGIIMGSVIAITQAVVAITMVGILAIAFGGNQLEIMDRTNNLEIISYTLIFAIGLYMTYEAVTGKTTCGHNHLGEPYYKNEGHNHDRTEHHGHNHGPDPKAQNTWLARTASRALGPQGEVIAVGIISGVRPCTGSILVLLFALANGVFLLGILAALTMAFGVAITISALGIGAIILRRSLAGKEKNMSPARALAAKILAVAGSLAVAMIGAILLGATLERSGFML